jgi:hypothetical protein
MSQKSAKSAAELESMIMAELREHPECESAGVVVSSKDIGWDAVLVREGAQLNDECEARLAEITNRLRQEFDLAE